MNRCRSSRSTAEGDKHLVDHEGRPEESLEEDADAFAAPAPLAPAEKKALRSESYKVRKQQKDY